MSAQDETYPLDRPCEYCGDRIVDHTPSELKSCVLDLEARALGLEVRADEVLNFPYWEQDADALAWWRSQQ